ncbi:hypothetical protein HYT04_00575 [Candidatus Kaiserbacteria bacterium]|nr:hypothetical protein [Candidatus Kaiserbacteria bacterium]
MSLQILLAKRTPYVSPEIPIFDKMVRQGEAESFITLPILHHGFLVWCLVEHLSDVEIFHDRIALNLLNATTKKREQANMFLMRAGDEALLLAGLFPESARRLNVSSSYFRFMGQAAYASLAARYMVTGMDGRGGFFDKMAEDFPFLEKVLRATRSKH